jgi:peroxiredoxin
MIRFVPALLALAMTSAVHAATGGLEVGQTVPEFAVADETGANHALSTYRGKVVVLEWTNPECPYVARHYSRDTMEKLARSYGGRGVVWLAVNSTYSDTPADTRKWKQEQGFEYGTLQDASGELGKRFGARTTPHMFIIDGRGVLRYEGAIDDDPRGRKQDARNFVDTGLGAVLAGAAPEPSSTQPYGCSVKYR